MQVQNAVDYDKVIEAVVNKTGLEISIVEQVIDAEDEVLQELGIVVVEE